MFPSYLKVAVVTLPYFLEINESLVGHKRVSGIEGELLNIIAGALGFEYKLIIPEDREWGQERPDGNWTGLMGKVIRGEADMALSYIAMTAQRAEVADFSTFYTFEESTFIIAKPRHTERFSFTYLHPFELWVWTLLFITMTILTFLFYRLTGRKIAYELLFLRLFSSVLRQPFKINFSSKKEKLLISMWLFFALVISLSYSATLLSFLTIPFHHVSVKNFRELSNAVMRGTHKCYLWRNTSSIQFLLKSNEEHLQNLGKAIERNEWFLNINATGVKSRTHIKHNSCVLRSRNILRLFYSVPDFESRYMISSDILGVWPVAIVLNKHFCCKSKLNNVISRLRSAGIYQKLISDASVKLWTENSKDEKMKDEDFAKLSIDDISGPLMLLKVGYALSIIVLLGEIVCFHWRGKVANIIGTIKAGWTTGKNN